MKLSTDVQIIHSKSFCNFQFADLLAGAFATRSRHDTSWLLCFRTALIFSSSCFSEGSFTRVQNLVEQIPSGSNTVMIIGGHSLSTTKILSIQWRCRILLINSLHTASLHWINVLELSRQFQIVHVDVVLPRAHGEAFPRRICFPSSVFQCNLPTRSHTRPARGQP